MAPVTTFLERRVDARLPIAAGHALLAVGLLGNGFTTFETAISGDCSGRSSCVPPP